MVDNSFRLKDEFFWPKVSVFIWVCLASHRQRADRSGKYLRILGYRILNGLTRVMRKGVVH
ncbi:MAG: hypothetical protein FOGNACKC_03610 [Anaerolineae bacterium]|nr:hypothetical protein [Anaerolineae bacterium]